MSQPPPPIPGDRAAARSRVGPMVGLVRRVALREGTVAAWGGQVLAVVLALRSTRGAWGPRAASGDDVMAQLVRTRWGIDHLLLHGRIDGWMPSFAVGYQEFLFFGPGFTWLLALVRLCTLGLVSNAGALKVVTVGSVAGFPLAVAFLARSYGLSRRAAGIASILGLLVNNPFGVGLSAVFSVALVPQQVGAILACVCIGSVMRVLAEPRPRWVVLAATASAALVVTHVISVFIVLAVLAVTVPVLWVSDRPGLAAVRHVALAAGGAAGLSAFWVVPFLAHRALHGPVTTWATPSLGARLAEIVQGTYLLRPHVAILVLVGAAFGVARVARGHRWAAALVLTPPGFIALARVAIHRYPANEIAIQLENRGIGLVAVIALFGLAAAVAWATRRAGVVGDAAAVVLVLATAGPWSRIAQQTPIAAPGIRQAARIIARTVPPGARFAEVRQYPADGNAAGVAHPDFWLAWASGKPALNEFNVESTLASSPAFTPEHLLDHPADKDADDLARAGVTDVVAATTTAREHLLASSRFSVVWQDGEWSVLALSGAADQPDPATQLATDGAASAVLRRAGTEHLRIDVQAPSPTAATLAIGWSPRWRVRVNGHGAGAHRSADGLIALRLPAGASVVAVDWRADPWALLGAALTLLTLAGGLWELRRIVPAARGAPGAQGDEGPVIPLRSP